MSSRIRSNSAVVSGHSERSGRSNWRRSAISRQPPVELRRPLSAGPHSARRSTARTRVSRARSGTSRSTMSSAPASNTTISLTSSVVLTMATQGTRDTARMRRSVWTAPDTPFTSPSTTMAGGRVASLDNKCCDSGCTSAAKPCSLKKDANLRPKTGSASRMPTPNCAMPPLWRLMARSSCVQGVQHVPAAFPSIVQCDVAMSRIIARNYQKFVNSVPGDRSCQPRKTSRSGMLPVVPAGLGRSGTRPAATASTSARCCGRHTLRRS